MLLDELKKGQIAQIISIDAEKTLRDRFNSFGIIKEELVTLKEHSLAKKSLEIEVSHTLVILRDDEAKKIKVEIIK